MLRSAAIIIACVCIAPLLMVMAAWFLPFSADTLASWQHMKSMLLNDYLSETALLCFGVAIISGCLGTGCAWLTTHYSFTGRTWFEWCLILPLAMPAYVSAYAYGYLFEFAGPVQSMLRDTMGWDKSDYYFPAIRSLGGAIWILGLATVPYVYVLARTAFLSQPREWWEAAATLGTSQAGFFRRIALPAARPFVATGIALALMETLADIGTVTVLGVQSISAGIYRSWFFMGEPLVAARLAGLLLVFVCIVMSLEALGRRGMQYHSLRQQSAELLQLYGGANFGALLLCLLPVCAGFILPLATLLRLSAYADFSMVSDALGRYVLQTVQLGSLAGACACAAALIMVCAERFHSRWMRPMSLLANLGYAIPGAVVAVGLMLLFGYLREHVHSSLIITGNIAGLLIAYTVRFMATAYNPLHGGMLRVPQELDMAAASLGRSRLATWWHVHLPLLAMPICAAFIVVFLDTVKELPATLILRPFDVKTLAVAAYEFASDDRHVEASPYALLLVAMSTLAVLAFHHIQQRSMRWRHV